MRRNDDTEETHDRWLDVEHREENVRVKIRH